MPPDNLKNVRSKIDDHESKAVMAATAGTNHNYEKERKPEHLPDVRHAKSGIDDHSAAGQQAAMSKLPRPPTPTFDLKKGVDMKDGDGALADRSPAFNASFKRGEDLEKKGELVAALVDYEKATCIAEETGLRVEGARACDRQGRICQKLYRWRDATAHHQMSLDFLRRDDLLPTIGYAQPRTDEVPACSQLAFCYLQCSDFAAASDFFNQAIAQAENLRLPGALASAKAGLGSTFGCQGFFDFACENHLDHLAHHKAMEAKTKGKNEHSVACVNLGVDYLYLQRFAEAKSLVMQYLAVQHAAVNKAGLVHAYRLLGDISFGLGSQQEAATWYGKLLELLAGDAAQEDEKKRMRLRPGIKEDALRRLGVCHACNGDAIECPEKAARWVPPPAPSEKKAEEEEKKKSAAKSRKANSNSNGAAAGSNQSNKSAAVSPKQTAADSVSSPDKNSASGAGGGGVDGGISAFTVADGLMAGGASVTPAAARESAVALFHQLLDFSVAEGDLEGNALAQHLIGATFLAMSQATPVAAPTPSQSASGGPTPLAMSRANSENDSSAPTATAAVGASALSSSSVAAGGGATSASASAKKRSSSSGAAKDDSLAAGASTLSAGPSGSSVATANIPSVHAAAAAAATAAGLYTHPKAVGKYAGMASWSRDRCLSKATMHLEKAVGVWDELLKPAAVGYAKLNSPGRKIADDELVQRVVSRPNSPARPTVSPPNSPSGGGGGLSRSESGAQMIVSPSNTEIASLLSSARKWKPNLQKAETGRARALLDLLVAQSTPGSAFRDQMQNGSVPAYRWIITHFGSERDPSMYLTPAVKAVGMKLSASGGSSKGSQSNSRMTSAMTTPAPTPGRAKNASKGGGEHLAD